MEKLDIIETLKHFPSLVEVELSGLSDAALRQKPEAGGWSIKEVVGHLADYAAVQHRRFYSVWSLFDPLFPAYDEKKAVDEGGFQEADIASLLRSFSENRLKAVHVLVEAVDWTKLGQQPRVGRRTLKQFAERAIAHDTAHLEQIRALKAGLGAVSRAG